MKSKVFAAVLMSLIASHASAECQGVAPTQQGASGAEEPGAPIQSKADLLKYLGDLPDQSPLRALSEDARSSFIASLRFHEDGLASFSTKEMERGLTLRQAHDVLALFGMQEAILKLPIEATSKQEAELLEQMKRRCQARRSA
ncbi:hypothetical protein [Stenotrophomonas oahuensis]|uniref:Uncharacterized protein n=1 Tax=Stenotrophomonas oahuensis TaxID=3003271 RepID=A0ABY9YTQ5_9GAMM|nr:hypothetical protein [Stenotrophomonas sp. A5586]WNH54319.1 hypothetical protein PDM29_08585 [Stenotrophomonas sp. A5586]